MLRSMFLHVSTNNMPGPSRGSNPERRCAKPKTKPLHYRTSLASLIVSAQLGNCTSAQTLPIDQTFPCHKSFPLDNLPGQIDGFRWQVFINTSALIRFLSTRMENTRFPCPESIPLHNLPELNTTKSRWNRGIWLAGIYQYKCRICFLSTQTENNIRFPCPESIPLDNLPELNTGF